MASRDHDVSVNLGGKSAIVVFIIALVAFVTETQLSQYVQTELDFRQPFLLFYIVHSSFAIMLPLHVLFLTLSGKNSPRALWAGLMLALRQHLSPPTGPVTQSSDFPTWRLARLLSFLTAGMTFPALLWFIAVSLASVTDVTALWNTNAFFAYLLTVRFLKLRWDPRRLAAVILATLGATAVVYGGSTANTPEASLWGKRSIASVLRRAVFVPSAPLIGDLLTLVASVLYGLYQVLYKIYAALPSDPEVLDDEVPTDALYRRLPTSYDSTLDIDEAAVNIPQVADEAVYPPPFGLYPNMLTSAIGVLTLLVLWIPIPILDYYGISTFSLPKTSLQVVAIAGIALSGVVFNAGFMILLGVWGPVVTSVGSLLTIVLVFISDIIFGGAVETITPWGLLGSGSIVIAFALLAYDMTRRRHPADSTSHP
ncbi:uncharacterized protein LAESUDRAFT_661140 [Laetiporus sulphureus 93-53]|uniref:EamA domain-containing protein n=1 Tax=Laetiporus sulphureus 93-53 TaxID=1314785 RepID=A0A165CES6_9APHY|nr:uncharacterized protein LAESUDRAFT_661140 [Laetiporus sulphureus 93-53]KZT02682.1 hypothetical protein LAESUDRAFT_661140 [Laetiporus sulphureus 93-53]